MGLKTENRSTRQTRIDVRQEGIPASPEARCDPMDAINPQVNPQQISVRHYQKIVEARLETWQATNFNRRMWSKDPMLWASRPVPELSDRLGWLTLPDTMAGHVEDLRQFARHIQAEGIAHVVVLGMGGSSLAPEVFQRTFGNASGYPKLIVLDSTHPAAVRAIEAQVDLRRTLFLVSSKSGTTLEPLSFFRYFWHRVGQVVSAAGKQFVAITDPKTPLEQLAREREFRHVFLAPSDVGGRYSALTVFGLVPAALIGIDVHRLLDHAKVIARRCAPSVPERENPGLALGATLGEIARAGKDKLTILASATLMGFPEWLEQLVAESTGKDGKGILPVADEPLGDPGRYGTDRIFAYLRLHGDNPKGLDTQIAALEQTGHPLVRIDIAEAATLGQEFFRWEIAVAAAGAVSGIHPFNQPDVELAKELARRAMSAENAVHASAFEEVRVDDRKGLEHAVVAWLARRHPRDYLAVQAYLAPTTLTQVTLQQMRTVLRDRFRLATTFGFGPRFLHSTGQFHKGGPNTGLFLQLVDEPTHDLAVPETDYTFGKIIHAQSVGDYQALRQRDRRVLRVSLGTNVEVGLTRLAETIRSSAAVD
jgi:transaldolase/glucose-6-phosphate isomerase